MKLSVVIPAYNEQDSIPETLRSLHQTLTREGIEHEIFVTNDNSKDNTLQVLQQLSLEIPTLHFETNKGPNGFGYAVRYGLERFSGDCVAVMMADMSDDPEDLVRFYRKMQETDADAVFGSRWVKGGKVIDYPALKKTINRVANLIIRVMIGIKYNDTTNAFKLYKRETIEGIKPFLSPHFNLTVELPLKAYVRGYSFEIVPNSWTNRKYGESKLKIKEMGSRYFFILLYCMIEKFFSRGDYLKKKTAQNATVSR
ncbi:glycosyltransferase family 2 protein [Siphonobacter aquaeclarae]|jgi:dolichol-phosphate mannosyltransferase|uniref:Dolichol-phosphate mannosyltransferase n=1 Tax=Siphonobacter aquaeclarae TaxID=563176 RepID=A0A1G9WRJ3_9BACT|nr:glycosyltransferase family 2 protein [Siphonobacter aquaeclarae]MBO9638274.1 glycosyltransferase family 2 protein [Siphonobacter aquaeclarae]SDM87202.1 dolichol-phosphate mannosyltransferase [Siphonobacter aquaeclarae]